MVISGIGCCVVDYIYKNIDFTSPAVSKFVSSDGKNGLLIGEANLIDDLVDYFDTSLDSLINHITNNKKPSVNLGGVAIIALITAAQLLYDASDVKIFFYANLPNTELGEYIFKTLKSTPIFLDHIHIKDGKDTITYVFCEKENNGDATRTFLGYPHTDSSTTLKLGQLEDGFYDSDINYFGHIRWEPEINDNLSYVLKKCKSKGNITVLSTASDPTMKGKKQWLLGDSDDVYNYISFLIMNKSEALHYSGKTDFHDAVNFFKSFPIEGLLITDGVKPTYVYSKDGICLPYEGSIPIVQDIIDDKNKGILPQGDTIGCGDNFVGGVIASIASQLRKGKNQIDLKEACIFGNINGALASTIKGGLFKEKFWGERKKLVEQYLCKYKKQLTKLKE